MRIFNKIMSVYIAVIVLSSCSFAANNDSTVSVIPRPRQIQVHEGVFRLDAATVIHAEGPARHEAKVFVEMLHPALGFSIPVKDTPGSPSKPIQLRLLDDAATEELGDEGYRLSVKPQKVIITARAAAGLFYGAQTLRQLLPPEIFASSVQKNIRWDIPCVEITDTPRFKWRGMMLDVSRHFFDADFVKKYIDYLAMHKINVFHWHLTDDDGWRIEIKKYPKLTEIGAWRGPDEALPPSRSHLDQRYGGFYTQEQIRDIVAYAADRHINIMPEIDIPGHALAITTAYPETLPSVVGESKSVQGVKANAISPAREANYEMLDNIFREVASLFPFEYIHVGGDEVNKKTWKACPQIKALMEREGLKDLHQVQNYFTGRLEKIIHGHNRRMTGWNEILSGGNLHPETTVMSWTGTEPGIKAAKRGYPVIMSPGPYTYFDMKYPGSGERGHWWAGIISTEKVYSFDPLGLTALNPEELKRILGVEACLWTEFVEDTARAEYQTYPRLCALSEVGWTAQENRKWDQFRVRMGDHLSRLHARSIGFRVPPPIAITREGMVTLTPMYPGMDVYYTTNGTDPSDRSTRYTKPFRCDTVNLLRSIAYSQSRPSNIKIGASRQPFAKWVPGDLSTEFKKITFDVTDEVRSNGNWKLEFICEKGRNKLLVRSAVLLEDGKEIARDQHDGAAWKRGADRNVYTLPVESYRSDAGYAVVVEVRAEGGNHYFGSLTLDRSVWLEPKAAAKTDIPHYGNNHAQNLTDWHRKTYFWSKRPLKKGESILLTLDKPITCSYIESHTGKLNDPNADMMKDGVLEISSDGQTFRPVAEYVYGVARAELKQDIINAIRITATADQADQWLVVQDILLK